MVFRSSWFLGNIIMGTSPSPREHRLNSRVKTKRLSHRRTGRIKLGVRTSNYPSVPYFLFRSRDFGKYLEGIPSRIPTHPQRSSFNRSWKLMEHLNSPGSSVGETFTRTSRQSNEVSIKAL